MATINKNTIKVISTLIESGIRTGQDITNLGLKNMLDMPAITKSDMRVIMDLQTAIKENRLFECLVDDSESDGPRRKRSADVREENADENS